MKKIALIFFAITLVFSCQKKDVKPVQMQQDVVFNVTQIDPGSGLKSTADWTCPTDNDGNLPEAVSAEIDIYDGTTTTTYTPAVFRLDGNLYTQAIKLPAADGTPTTYTVTKFLLKDANGVVIMATPTTGSDYSEYVSQGVSFTFEVNAFAKAEVPVEVLCFLPEDYTYFGFDWFNVTEIVVREFCFFGDICLKHPSDYEGSDYENQSTGLQIDMPALIKIEVTDGNGDPVPHSPFSNGSAEENWGVGSPLCVQYPDNLQDAGEIFTFKLYILVKQGSGFGYKYFATFTVTDDGALMDESGNPVPDNGQDGVVDFVLGSCNYSETDVQLPPYQNLPSSCTLMIESTWAPAPVSGEYMDAIISGISGSGYDLTNGTYGSYCYDRLTGIDVRPHYYTMDIYSTLYPGLMPPYVQEEEWDRVNWLINHLDDYAWDWSDLQQVIWKLEDPSWPGTPYGGCNAITSVGIDMYNDAVANGDGYVPLPGGWAAVCFVPQGTPPDQQDPVVQTVFVRVDP